MIGGGEMDVRKGLGDRRGRWGDRGFLSVFMDSGGGFDGVGFLDWSNWMSMSLVLIELVD